MEQTNDAVIRLNGDIVNDSDKWLYDWLGWTAVCPKDVTNVLSTLAGKPLLVKINSPGGSLWAGLEIYTELMQYPGPVTLEVQSLAASAASIIAMASAKKGSRCIMSPVAQMFVHCAQSAAEGDHADMEARADELRKADKSIAQAYMLKTGMTETEALALMEADTWMTAEEALARGLVDEVMEYELGPSAEAAEASASAHRDNIARAGTRQLMNAIPTMTPGTLEKLKALLAAPGAATDEIVPPPGTAVDDDEAHRLAQARLELEQKRYGGLDK